MKKLLLFLTLFGLIAFTQAQRRIITVNNDPLAPGQYTTIAAAITAATAGDTIYVSGSATSYGAITVTKKLTIIGTAHTPDDQFDLKPKFGAITITAAATGSSFIGLHTEGGNPQIVPSTDTHNILFKNCNFAFTGYILNKPTENCDNWIFEGNQVSGQIIMSPNFDNTVFKNNLFKKGPLVNTNSSTLIFNNVFYFATSWSFQSCNNSMVFNNIFYLTGYKETEAPDNGCSGCTFNNNITFAPNLMIEAKTLPIIPGATNLGGGNLNNTDPKFLGLEDLTKYFTYPTTSPIVKAGTDGTDLGIYGANYNFSPRGYSAIPQIYFMNISNAVVPVNGTLNVNIKAKKQD